MSDISLTSAMRANLLQLQKSESLIDRTQQRISTGKKVNTALDGPAAFFAAKSLTDRAADLTALKDSMGQAISTIKAADNAITAITDLVQQAKALANTAKQNLGTDQASKDSRKTSADQFNVLMTQINELVQDASYAGKNLLLGDGAVYDATTQSIANVDTLTGISSAAVTNIGGGDAANNIEVKVAGVVEANSTSASTLETDLGFTSGSTAATGFTAADSITFNTYDRDGTTGKEIVTTSNTYSSGYTEIATSATATTYTQYLVSAGSGATTESTLGIKNFEVINWKGNEDVDVTVASSGGTTTFTVTTPTTSNTTLYTAAQTATDSAGYSDRIFAWGDKAKSLADMGFLDADASSSDSFQITAVAPDADGDEVVSLQVDRTIFDNGSSSVMRYSMTVTYADGSTTTSSNVDVASVAGSSAVTLSVGGTTVTFLGDDVTGGATSAVMNLTTVKFSGAGAGGGGSIAGNYSADIGKLDFNTASSDISGLKFATGKTLSLDDNRDIKITQGSLNYTRAVVPTTGEGTLTTGKNNFVLSNGAQVDLTVDLNILTAGTQTIAAYTKTAGGTSNDLTVNFNSKATAKVTIKSVDTATKGLSVANAANSWLDSADIDQAITQLDAALSTLRDTGQTLTNNLSVVQTREDFTTEFVNTLEEGADKWLLADTNKEGANLLILQTRQQLGTVSLSIASQSAQSILRLFG